MSGPSSTGTENTGSSKKQVSPVRKAVGLVALLAMLVICGIQYWAFFGYNRAVKALDARTTDEDKGLLQVAEAESLLGRQPDGPGGDVDEGARSFTKKTYTWRGLRSYTLTAFYTKEANPYLHHFETEGAKYVAEAPVVLPSGPVAAVPPRMKGMGKRKASGPPAGLSTDVAKTATVPGAATAEPTPAALQPKADTATATAPAKPAGPTAEPSKDAAPTAAAPAKPAGPTVEPPKGAAPAKEPK